MADEGEVKVETVEYGKIGEQPSCTATTVAQFKFNLGSSSTLSPVINEAGNIDGVFFQGDWDDKLHDILRQLRKLR